MPQTVSVQGNFRSTSFNNIKSYHDHGQSITQTRSLFQWTSKQEEGLLGVYSPHLDVIVEDIEVQSSVVFEFFLDEEFIEFWWDDLMFESPHATIFV